MAQSSKRGLRSDSQKRDSSRHDFDPAPSAAPVEGAFGRQGEPTAEERTKPHWDSAQKPSSIADLEPAPEPATEPELEESPAGAQGGRSQG